MGQKMYISDMNETTVLEPSAPVPATAPAAGDVIHALSEAARCVHARMEALLEGTGLSAAKYAALDQLAGTGEPLTLGELAERLGCVRSNVTQLVDRLEADGLVERRACPGDRRAVRALLTDHGRACHAEGRRAIAGLTDELSGRFTDDERGELVRLLALLH